MKVYIVLEFLIKTNDTRITDVYLTLDAAQHRVNRLELRYSAKVSYHIIQKSIREIKVPINDKFNTLCRLVQILMPNDAFLAKSIARYHIENKC